MFLTLPFLTLLTIAYGLEEPSIIPVVLDGSKVNPENHKHLVFIAGNGNCSGVILRPSWILTAAHCALENSGPYNISHFHKNKLHHIAEVGNELDEDKFVYSPFIIYRIAFNDVALLRTKERIVFNEYIQPIGLATVPVRENDTAVIAGYGLTKYDGKRPSYHPMCGPITVKECMNRFIFCASGHVRAYFGDSGGPVVMNGRLVGIVQGLMDINGEELDVYISIPAFVSWIKNVIRNN